MEDFILFLQRFIVGLALGISFLTLFGIWWFYA